VLLNLVVLRCHVCLCREWIIFRFIYACYFVDELDLSFLCLCGVCVCVCVFAHVCMFQQIKCIWLLLCLVYFAINFVFVIYLILGYRTMFPVKNTSSCSLSRVDDFFAENCMLSTQTGMELFQMHVTFHSVFN
jgi:hypothetical protein